MKKTGILFVSALIFMIFAVSFAYADDTTVTVIGMKGFVHNITLNVVKATSGELIQSLENDTDATTGLITFKYSSASQLVSYSVIARSNGKIIANRKYTDIGNFSTGVFTSIELFPGYTTPSSTTTSTTTTTNTTTVNLPGNQTAAAVDSSTNNSGNSTTIDIGKTLSSFNLSGIWEKVKSWSGTWLPRIAYAIIGLIVVIGIGYGGLWLWRRRDRSDKGGFFKKYEDVVSPKDKERSVVSGGSGSRKIEKELEAAERKIREAQEDINRIKNRKSVLSEAQKNFEKARRELEEAKEDFG